ncbi:MAG: GHKL domain-containing protein [Oligoflexia bacterium]|nr:GHKL domain-containing protein [Oligoflexia bacterium]
MNNLKAFFLKLVEGKNIQSKEVYFPPFVFFLTLIGIFYALYYFFIIPETKVGLIVSVSLLLFFTIPTLQRKFGHIFAGNFIVFMLYANLILIIYYTGGAQSPAVFWIASVPLFSIILSNNKSGAIWLILSSFSIAIVYYLSINHFIPITHINSKFLIPHFAITALTLTILISILALFTEMIRNKIEKEREDIEQKAYRNSNLAALGEMAGGIAHEINNPLMIINGSVMVIEKMRKKGELDLEKLERHLQTITKTVKRTATIIKGLKTLSRDGKNDESDTFKVRELVEDVLTFISGRFKYESIELKFNELDENLDLDIKGQSVQISQVLLNLIGNAFDAVKGEPDSWIDITTDVNDTHVIINITDSGNGIPLELQKKIFNPFFTTKEVGKGTGLGLSLCHTIMEKNDGEIFIDQDCANTRFVMTIPKA